VVVLVREKIHIRISSDAKIILKKHTKCQSGFIIYVFPFGMEYIQDGRYVSGVIRPRFPRRVRSIDNKMQLNIFHSFLNKSKISWPFRQKQNEIKPPIWRGVAADQTASLAILHLSQPFTMYLNFLSNNLMNRII
jgi:hypothetical protein